MSADAEALAAAWDQGLAFARKQAYEDFEYHRNRSGIFKGGSNRDIQPFRDALDAVGGASVNEYNDFVHSITAYSIAEALTVNPERPDGEGGVIEADDDPNPYR